MSKSKGSPRKFAEKIALLNKKEAEANAEFEKIIKEVEETTRVSSSYQQAAYASIASAVGAPTKGTPLTQPPALSNNDPSGWFQSELHYVESLQPAAAFGAPVRPANPNNYQHVNQHQYHPTNNTNNQTTTTNNTTTNTNNHNNTSNSMSRLNHYSNCQIEQQHQTTLVAPQDLLIEDSLTPPSVATNSSIPNIKVHLTSDDNTSYPQAQQNISPRQSPQPQPQHHNQQHLHHMNCFASSPITIARSLPDIANLRVSTSLTTMAPSYSDHQLPASDDYNYDYDYDANSNIVQTSNSPNYCSEANNAPQLDLASCHQPTSTPSGSYNNYPPPTVLNMHHPNQTTQTNTNYYTANSNQHLHNCSTNQLAHMNRANSTGIVHQPSNKLLNCEDDFLAEPRVSNGLSRSTEACYDLMRPFAYDIYETRNPLSQFVDGGGPQRKLRSSSYNNLESINSHHPSPAQLYTQQPQSTAQHICVPSQQFYN